MRDLRREEEQQQQHAQGPSDTRQVQLAMRTEQEIRDKLEQLRCVGSRIRL